MPTPQDLLDQEMKETQAQLEKELSEETPQKTPEEIKAEAEEAAKKAQEDADAIKAKEAEEAEAQRLADEEAAKKAQESETDEGEKEVKTTPSTEERYKESTKEAQKLYRNNVAMNKAIEEGNNLPEPTEEELQAAYPEWQDMSATERLLSKESLINKRFRAHINAVSAGQREIDKWEERVEKYVEDPQTLIDHPELDSKGKSQAFKEFVTTNKKLVGTDFDILVAAFLHEQSLNKPEPKKGKMFETGSGGAKEKIEVKSDKISVDEAAKLMETDYALWKKLLAEGKFETVT